MYAGEKGNGRRGLGEYFSKISEEVEEMEEKLGGKDAD